MERILSMPAPGGTIEDKVRGVLSWVDSAIEKRRWSDAEIEGKFALRAAREILQEGHTCYMNPCLDYTLVLLEALKQMGFEASFIIEELKDPDYRQNRVHFAVEFTDGNEKYHLEVSTFNRVILGKGDYFNHKKGIERVGIIRIPGSQITPDKNLLQILGIDSLHETQRLANGFSFEPQLELLRKSNNEQTYRAYAQRLGEKSRLWLDAYPQS